MALARCGIVSQYVGLLWGRNVRRGSGTDLAGKHYRLRPPGTGPVAEMVDPHCAHISKAAANKQLAPSD